MSEPKYFDETGKPCEWHEGSQTGYGDMRMERDQLVHEMEGLRRKLDEVLAEHDSMGAERDRLAGELEKLKKERGDFGREVEQAAHTVIDALEAERDALRAAIKWVTDDMGYKPPEMAAECVSIWHARLTAALAARGKDEWRIG